MAGHYFPEEEGLKLKCPYRDCAWAMGLAGRGVCEMRGLWWTLSCPAYQTEEECELEWKKQN